MEQQNKICKDWRELNTPFGKLYIEPWNWHLNNIFPYDDSDRITIYDSRGDWFDYFPLDYFYEAWDEEELDEEEYLSEEEFAEEEYERLCDMLTQGAEQTTIEGFLNWLGVNFLYAGADKVQAGLALSDGHPEELTPDEIETNEYVNHIGDNYIVVTDI